MSKEFDRGGQAFVLGHPVDHSLSPALHNAAYHQLGVKIHYDRWDTTVDELGDRMAYAQSHRVCGYSCTMPLKDAVKSHLDRLTPFAEAVGVVNTVTWQRENSGAAQAWGHNTDVSGIVNALHHAGAHTHRVAIIGGGGTATAAVAAARFMGAGEVDVFVRSVARADLVRQVAQRVGLTLNFYSLDCFAERAACYSAIICTLPSGAADELIEHGGEHVSGTLLDVSYDPWPSELARRWESRGGAITSGKEMLMYQAVEQIRLFLGYELDQRLPQEDQVVHAMCTAIGLPPRHGESIRVYDAGKLQPQGTVPIE